MSRNYYNRNNPGYMLIDTIEKLLIIYNNYENIIEKKNEEIKQLMENMNPVNNVQGFINNVIEFKVDSTINNAYLQYIIKYGPPSDGIFLESLLDEFR